MSLFKRWLLKLIRKKVFVAEDLDKTNLRRCLTTVDLIGLGMSATMGSGVYIVAGQLARETAGPAVVVSFLIAGLTAALAGFSYAEFAARVPSAGSAYVYSYVTVGELMAFVIGWNVLLEYVISTASGARALSAYLDYLLDNRMQRFFQQYMPITATGLSSFPDFFAFGLVMLLTGLAAKGVKESVTINNLFTIVNLLVLTFIVICGLTKADLHNWALSGNELPASDAGNGGFAPFGVSGILAGSATCFFAYIGFDFVASMGEEAENSRWSIPVSMGVTLAANIVFYCSVSAVVSLMAPYFILDIKAPLAFVFVHVGWPGVKYVVAVGAFCGLFTTLMGSIFPMARVIYAMASDGLLFRCLSSVHSRLKTPLPATLISGTFSAVMALLIDLKELIDMTSIGTLLAFDLVALCVLILRYKTASLEEGNSGTVENTPTPIQVENDFKWRFLFKPNSGTPTLVSERLAEVSIAVMCVSVVSLCAVVTFGYSSLLEGSVWVVTMTVTLTVITLISVIVLRCQPQSAERIRFKVPLVPFVPVLSFAINVYLMFQLNTITWLRLLIWMILGFCIYFFYGIRHSSVNEARDEHSSLCASPVHIPSYTQASDPNAVVSFQAILSQ